jgi:hypothetical protein
LRLRGKAATAAVVAVVAGSGAAFAFSNASDDYTDANGVYHGCVNRTNGQLRVLAGGACKNGEDAITWNRTGPKGDQGVRGPQG